MPSGGPSFCLWHIHRLLCLPAGLTLTLESMSELWNAGTEFHMWMTRESLFPLNSMKWDVHHKSLLDHSWLLQRVYCLLVLYCLLALNMNVGKANFSPEAEFVLVNFSKRVLVSKENLLGYCVIWELFTFGCRTKPENLNSMNHNKTNYKMHNYSRL